MTRDIKNGNFGWYEKGALKKIETLEFKKQASCKLIYFALCSVSASNKNSSEIECYKFDIAKFASVSEKTVQRYLPLLEKLMIIKVSPQDRKSNGKFEKVKIWLNNNNVPAGQMRDRCETDARQMEDTESDIYKEINKERNKESIIVKNKKFVEPTIEEIRSVFLEKGIEYQEADIEAEKFFNFYDSKGWKVGKNKMKKWKSAAANWLIQKKERESLSLKNIPPFKKLQIMEEQKRKQEADEAVKLFNRE